MAEKFKEIYEKEKIKEDYKRANARIETLNLNEESDVSDNEKEVQIDVDDQDLI